MHDPCLRHAPSSGLPEATPLSFPVGPKPWIDASNHTLFGLSSFHRRKFFSWPSPYADRPSPRLANHQQRPRQHEKSGEKRTQQRGGGSPPRKMSHIAEQSCMYDNASLPSCSSLPNIRALLRYRLLDGQSRRDACRYRLPDWQRPTVFPAQDELLKPRQPVARRALRPAAPPRAGLSNLPQPSTFSSRDGFVLAILTTRSLCQP